MAAQLGYCGLDRQRRPLQGDEIRPCWEAADAARTTIASLPGIGPVWPLDPGSTRTDVRALEFVEVEPAADGALDEAIGDALVPTTPSRAEPRWSLWGEAEA